MYDQVVGFISNYALCGRSWKSIIGMINSFHKCFKDLLPYSRVMSLRRPAKAGFMRYEKWNILDGMMGKCGVREAIL